MSAPRHIVLLGGQGGFSGVQRYIERLAPILSETARVTVLSCSDPEGAYAIPGAAHREVPGLSSSLNPARIRIAERGLTQALAEDPPDLLWAHARLTLPLARIWRRSHPETRLICTYHGMPFGPGRPHSALFRAAEWAALRATAPHDLVFLTEGARDALPSWVHRRHRSYVIANSSHLGPLPAPQPRSGPVRIVMTTRYAAQKNLPAAARLFAALPGAPELHLLGQGTEDPALRADLAAILTPEALKRVIVHGSVADVRPHLLAADLYLQTSRYEGMSIGALEGFEAGLPLALTPTDGAPEMVRAHPLAALLPSEPQAVQEAIRAAWARAFGPDHWSAEIRALIAA